MLKRRNSSGWEKSTSFYDLTERNGEAILTSVEVTGSSPDKGLKKNFAMKHIACAYIRVFPFSTFKFCL